MSFMSRLPRRWRDRLSRWWDKIVYWVGYPYYAVRGALIGTWGFLVRAWGTRRFRTFLQGIPAIAGMAVVGVASAFVLAGQSQDRRANLSVEYMNQAYQSVRKSRNTRDNETEERNRHLADARTFVEKAILLDGGDRDDQMFFLAQLLAESKQYEHSLAIMRKLAPDNANGYGPAHLFLGDYYASQLVPGQKSLEFVERHYVRAYEASKSKPDSPEFLTAALRLGNLYGNTGRLADAAKMLEKVEEQFPAQRLVLAEIYRRLNRPDDAKRLIASAERYYTARINERPDDKESRGYLSNAYLLQERFGDAIEILRKGMVLSDDKRFPTRIAEIYGLWEAYVSRQPGNNLLARLKLIQDGLAAMPSNLYLLGRLQSIADMTGPEGESAREMFQKLLAEGQSAPILHHLLAVQAYSKGKSEEAKFHWEKALATESSAAPLIMNNLAWLLTFQERPDYDRALDLIERVVAKNPDIPAFNGTRGVVLAKLKRYKEALPDLEKGVRATPQSPELHKALEESYEHLGNKSMAEIHRRKVEELTKGQPGFRPGGPVVPVLPGDKPVGADGGKPTPQADLPKAELPKSGDGKSDQPKAPVPAADRPMPKG